MERGTKRLSLLLLIAICACAALWPLAGGAAGAEDTQAPTIRLSYPPRQNITSGDSVLVRVSSDEQANVTASGQLETGSAPKKTYGRNLWSLSGAETQVSANGAEALRLHIPRNAQQAAKRAVSHGQKAVVKVTVTATDYTGNVTKRVAVISPQR